MASRRSERATLRRGWPGSAVYSAALTAALLIFAVIVNSLIGRTIHWDLVAILGSLAFVSLALGRRMRFI